MIIRIVYSKGTRRVEVNEKDNLSQLYKLVKETLEIENFTLSKNRNGQPALHRSRKHIKNENINHGDMIFLIENKGMTEDTENTEEKDESSKCDATISVNNEDEIDKILAKKDGKIYRNKGSFCQHGSSGKCINCLPLEPYDEKYLETCDPPIKFISFHSFLRKSQDKDGGKFTKLENINCQIKNGCTSHLPWPQGICTRCQPPALTLNTQPYRHVDNVMFENANIMNDFLNFWRKTGCQRLGILMGYYTEFDQSPLGIKAVVCAIHEPNQMNDKTHAHFVGNNNEEMNEQNLICPSVLDMSKRLGLKPIGWIFTDLKVEDANEGTVRHYRGTSDTFFLTAQECITAAHLQNMFPNPCLMSSEGYFGSKFVTVVVTGNKENEIHFEGYQVSNQCMGLVKDHILFPTKGAPELGYICETSNEKYVPDVFYKQKDKYGNEIAKIGRPLPLEFLLVHMTVAFSAEPKYTFSNHRFNRNGFPIENRQDLGEDQCMSSFIKYMGQFNKTEILEALSNFHLLSYLNRNDNLIPKEKVVKLCEFLNGKSATDPNNSSDGCHLLKEWVHVIETLKSVHLTSSPVIKTQGHNSWSCQHCTFTNIFSTDTCELCSLPQN